MDFYGGHAVAGLGYGHPRWLAALERQARQMAFQTNALPMAIRERAAARLAKFAGLGLDTVFWINSGAEANENALKLAFKITGRSKAVALEQGWHGRTAAAGAVTWGALEKWYGFPRTPFDVSFTPRNDPAAVERCVDRDTAAVIVEPIQGVGGAYDVGKPMLEALRRRCDEVGAMLIFDEVQCGMGRTGAPFGANYYGVTPDMITAAKALGNGFPVSALLLSRRVAGQIKYDDMGTTFGGGPMACAVAEAVIDTIESESLLANVRQVSAYIRASCIIGPVTGVQGAGFLLGLKTSRPAKEVQAALLEKGILTGTSARSQHPAPAAGVHLERRTCRSAARRAGEDFGMKRFLDLADFSREEILDLLALAQSLQDKPQPQALAGKILGLVFFNPSLRTLASFQAGMARLGGSSFVITPGQGTWQLETRLNAIMNGAAAEHIREGIPVLASYCDALGVRAFAEGKSLDDDLRETLFGLIDALCDKPLINMESADESSLPGAGGLAHHGRARDTEPREIRVELGLSSEGAAAGRARGDRCTWPRCAAWTWWCCARRASPCRRRSWRRRARPPPPPAARSPRPPIAPRRCTGASVLYAKEWGSTLYYGDAEADARLRADLQDWCVRERWFAARSARCQADALPAGAPQRRGRR